MLFNKVLLALAVSGFAERAIAQSGDQNGQEDQNQNQDQNQGQNNAGQGQGQGAATSIVQGNQAASTAASSAAVATGGAGGESDTLNADAIQTGSDFSGQEAGASGIKTGQAPAST